MDWKVKRRSLRIVPFFVTSRFLVLFEEFVEVTLQRIMPSGSTPGVLYGLPKVHKSGCPFRPIVSSINT